MTDATRKVAGVPGSSKVERSSRPDFGPTSRRSLRYAGVTAAYLRLLREVGPKSGRELRSTFEDPGTPATLRVASVIPPRRTQYLGEVAAAVRGYRRWAEGEVE